MLPDAAAFEKPVKSSDGVVGAVPSTFASAEGGRGGRDVADVVGRLGLVAVAVARGRRRIGGPRQRHRGEGAEGSADAVGHGRGRALDDRAARVDAGACVGPRRRASARRSSRTRGRRSSVTAWPVGAAESPLIVIACGRRCRRGRGRGHRLGARSGRTGRPGVGDRRRERRRGVVTAGRAAQPATAGDVREGDRGTAQRDLVGDGRVERERARAVSGGTRACWSPSRRTGRRRRSPRSAAVIFTVGTSGVTVNVAVFWTRGRRRVTITVCAPVAVVDAVQL